MPNEDPDVSVDTAGPTDSTHPAHGTTAKHACTSTKAIRMEQQQQTRWGDQRFRYQRKCKLTNKRSNTSNETNDRDRGIGLK